jgi:adenine-specific DNA-methyltransferase
MNLKLLKPKQSLNKAYLKEKISRTDIELFKTQFTALLDKINVNGDEEHLKSHIADFLKLTWYNNSQHQINPIAKNDLVIHMGKSPNDPYAAILEVKRPGNTGEMISANNPNLKAFHELVLYYLDERIKNNRNELKQLIITNIYDWYIIDANEFDKKIYRNTAIKKLYELKKADGKDNPWFYDELKKLLTANTDLFVETTFFDLRDYKKIILNTNRDDDKGLIALYKILSPAHLLKLPFANDSNTLQPKFYSELLHLIGLYEYKEGSKKLISRKKEGERNAGSLLENAIVQLDSHEKISRLDKPSQYGETYQERLYTVALELVITWINRILFLKLLEAQLINYHKGDRSYTFLNKDKIRDFDDLDKLFFRVLAKIPAERSEDIQKLFGKVPYLNSSLFEPTDLEHQTLFINGLEDFVPLPVISATVLKDAKSKILKGDLNTLDYLFAFLNAYDFSSEGAEEIQEDNKTLINASVLGLIFEKINGYKDGSFFTPGFITMYMCRETIRRAVVHKFNEAKGWECKEYSELYDKIEDKKEANIIINSLKICDPAVGSGHFLVSALNELLAIKSDLKILLDKDGRTLRDYNITVENDELIVTDADADIFEYNPQSKESQRIQETLFHEKQTIIENCLFGVDINPNSVKICRLRLWIELLKNAYYKAGGTELETLPNIDINIKVGNSLISRFALDADLKQALRNTKWNINDYKIAVGAYKNATNKAEKRELVTLIDSIKTNFRSSISRNAKEYKELGKLEIEYLTKYDSSQLFENKLNKKQLLDKKTLQVKIDKLKTTIDEIKNNKIYENAFEWRFEFPEVLDDNGLFVGFNVIIGNPPYGVSLNEKEKKYLGDSYKQTKGELEIYGFFIELSLDKILAIKGVFSFITTNTIYYLDKFSPIRKEIFLKNNIISLVELEKKVFVDAPDIVPAIYCVEKISSNEHLVNLYKAIKVKNVYDLTNFTDFNVGKIIQSKFLQRNNHIFNLETTDKKENLLKRLSTFANVSDNYKVLYGIKTGNNQTFVKKHITEIGNWKKCASSADNIKKYMISWKGDMLNVSKELAGLSNINYEQPKILIQYIRKISMPTRLVCALDENGELYPLNNFSFILSNKGHSLKVLLAILNSKLMNWYFSNSFVDYNIKPKYIEQLPLSLDLKSERLEIIITKIISLKENAAETLELENEIDQLVYQLYDLTKDEIKIIEGHA